MTYRDEEKHHAAEGEAAGVSQVSLNTKISLLELTVITNSSGRAVGPTCLQYYRSPPEGSDSETQK